MIISEDQLKILVNKINSLWVGTKKCQVCNQDKWTISDMIYEIRQFGSGNQKDSKVIPAIVVTCKNCGNIVYLNAITLGFTFNTNKEKEN